MIAFLHGRLTEALPSVITIDVHGVGYEVLIPLSSFDRLPAVGQEVRILTHLAVREDAHILFGFMSSAERDLFRLLVQTVSGIGPKLALNVLSGLSVPAFQAAVTSGDIKSLSSISGVGRKTAERIVVELKDKLGGLPAGTPGAAGSGDRPGPGEGSTLQDAVAALVALGFKPVDATNSVRGAISLLGESAPVDQLVRACLKRGA